MSPGANAARFAGFAEDYDRHRPAVPAAVADLLMGFARTPRPRRVVDVGCGTGLSMLAWLPRADEVVGVEPSADMRARARERFSGVAHARCVAGWSTHVPLESASADIVTVSQALHWMEPAGTFAEAARLLRPGGVLAAIDYECPPELDRQGEALYRRLLRHVRSLVVAGGHEAGVRKWAKDGHLERMRSSGRFREVRELTVRSVETGDAERLVGLAVSHGSVQALLRSGLTPEDIGLDALLAEATRLLGAGRRAWRFRYDLRIAVN